MSILFCKIKFFDKISMKNLLSYKSNNKFPQILLRIVREFCLKFKFCINKEWMQEFSNSILLELIRDSILSIPIPVFGALL